MRNRRQWLRAGLPAGLIQMLSARGLLGGIGGMGRMGGARLLSASLLAQHAHGQASPSHPQASVPPSSPHDVPPASLRPGEPLRFPHDHGAHPATRTEWWYITGEIDPTGPREQPMGFQITFFRTRVDVALANPSQFTARQLVIAHAALSDPHHGRLLHDQRIARAGFGLVEAAESDTRLTLRDWTLARSGPAGQGVYRSHIEARDFMLDLRLTQTQAPLLQGQGGQGLSRKSPSALHATRYYSLPHLRLDGRIRHRQGEMAVKGRAWLDHEWGEAILSHDTVGWDWLGMNLHDGGALMVFRTRRQDGSAVWHGGSLRRPGKPDRIFADAEIRMMPGDNWQSPATGARYPIAWTLDIAGVRYTVRARMPNQELDSLRSTGTIYWEGLCDLRDAAGRLIGAGYLEMTGYASPMVL